MHAALRLLVSRRNEFKQQLQDARQAEHARHQLATAAILQRYDDLVTAAEAQFLVDMRSGAEPEAQQSGATGTMIQGLAAGGPAVVEQSPPDHYPAATQVQDQVADNSDSVISDDGRQPDNSAGALFKFMCLDIWGGPHCRHSLRYINCI